MFNKKTQRPTTRIYFINGEFFDTDIQLLGNSATVMIPREKLYPVARLTNGWEIERIALNLGDKYSVAYLNKKQ